MVSANFVSGKREVYLEGEAQFAVASDTSRPFIVRTSGVEVEVVGTVFGVRAYEDDERTEVAVAEGEVVFRPSEARAATDTVVLRENHLGIVSGRLVQAERDGVVIGDHLGWTDGRLVFSDAPFDEVIRRLERWYDLDIELEIPSAAIDRLNATFEREPLDQVLGEISLALRLRYRKRGEAIIFYRQPDSA